MKSNSKKRTAEITAALTEATLVRSSAKKIMKTIDVTAKKMAKKINKRIDTATGKTEKQALKKDQGKAKKAEKKVAHETEALVTT